MYLKFKPEKFDFIPNTIDFNKSYEVTNEYFDTMIQTQYYFFTDEVGEDSMVCHLLDTDPIFELVGDENEMV